MKTDYTQVPLEVNKRVLGDKKRNNRYQKALLKIYCMHRRLNRPTRKFFYATTQISVAGVRGDVVKTRKSKLRYDNNLFARNNLNKM